LVRLKERPMQLSGYLLAVSLSIFCSVTAQGGAETPGDGAPLRPDVAKCFQWEIDRCNVEFEACANTQAARESSDAYCACFGDAYMCYMDCGEGTLPPTYFTVCSERCSGMQCRGGSAASSIHPSWAACGLSAFVIVASLVTRGAAAP
jgi:hypothetical protein